MAENIITQVSQDTYPSVPQQAYEETDNIDYDSRIHLNIRGTHFTITRDELMSLPESILLCLFPNGVFLDESGQVITNLTEEDVVFVNFDPDCFQYIIDTFGDAQRDLEKMPPLSPPPSGFNRYTQQETGATVLQSKPAIIVLREDLDYYVIPPISGLDADQIRKIKIAVSAELTKNKLIFSGLGYNPELPPTVDQKLGPAEQHLFDMLCSSGFDPHGIWGSRSAEPSRCVILSLMLVRLKADPPTPPESPSLDPIQSNSSSSRKSRSRIANLASSASRAASRSLSRSKRAIGTNQTKLLLFWRKPARKCWWSNESIDLDVSDLLNTDQKSMIVKVHIRRVWTLELSVVGVH